MPVRSIALAACAALGLAVLATPTRAQTILDLAIAGDPSIVDKQFRYLAHPPTNPSFAEPYTFAWGVSVNGVYAAGQSAARCPYNDTQVCRMASVWTPAFGTSPAVDEPFILPNLPLTGSAGDFASLARAIDDDGDTIVGWELIGYATETQIQAVAWTRAAGQSWETSAAVTFLEPGGTFNAAGARGINGAGNIAVGWSGDYVGDFIFNAIEASLWTRDGATWNQAILLGHIGTDPFSVANGVAVDANGEPVVVGWSGDITDEFILGKLLAGGSDDGFVVFDPAFQPRPFVWQGGPMQALPLALNQQRGDATAISADAKTIVGWTQVGSGMNSVEAVRWTHQGGSTWSAPQGLGIFQELPGNVASQVDPLTVPLGSVALAVSERGSAIAGYQVFGRPLNGGFGPDFRLAFIWTEALGTAQYLGDVLETAGVNIGEWVLFTATGVRENEEFFVVVGDGTPDGQVLGPRPGYIARLGREPHSPSGITTPGEQIESFGEISAAAMAVGSSVGTTLAGLNDTAENHRCIRPQDGPVGNWCFFTFGTANLFSGDGELDGNQFTGEVGIAHYFTPVTSIAASVGGGVVDSDLYLGGNYRASEVHVGGYVAHIPDQGFRAFFGGVWGDLTDIDLTRGYLNGIGLARSFGDTDGEAWGLLGRLGYGFQASPATFVTPFVEVSFTEASFAGYTETGGPFPTTFQGIDTNTTIGRLGVLHEQDLSATLRVYLQAAWAHVLDSETPIVRGAVLDIFELTAHGHGGIDDWAEFMAGARSQVSERGVLSVTGRIATEFDDFFSLGGRLGYSHIF